MKPASSEIGIVTQIISVARHLPRNTRTTRMTKMKANMMVSVSEEILSRIFSEPSIRTLISMSFGRFF